MGIKKEVIIGDCRLLLGDALDIMPLLDKVDAVVTDPPYGINYRPPKNPNKARCNSKYTGGIYKSGAKAILGDNQRFDPILILRLEVPTILWGANNYCHSLPENNGWLLWDKTRGGITNNGFIKSEGEMAWFSKGTRIKTISHLWDGIKRDSENGEKVFHATQKPIELMKWCIEQLPKDCNTILDPFMGSGTTGVACAKMGRKFIGIELDEGYFEIACKRIKAAYAEPDLFIEAAKKPTQEALL